MLQDYVFRWYHTYLLHPEIITTETMIFRNLYCPPLFFFASFSYSSNFPCSFTFSFSFIVIYLSYRTLFSYFASFPAFFDTAFFSELSRSSFKLDIFLLKYSLTILYFFSFLPTSSVLALLCLVFSYYFLFYSLAFLLFGYASGSFLSLYNAAFLLAWCLSFFPFP